MSETKVKDFFARPQNWGSADCFRFVWAVCCDSQNKDIEIDWDAGYLGSTSELDLIRKLKKEGIDPYQHLVDSFLLPLGLSRVKGDYRPDDVIVFDYVLNKKDGAVTYPAVGVVDNDYNPIDYDGCGINICRLPVREVWRYEE